MFPESGNAAQEVYQVQSGDTLSAIARRHFGRNVYGKSGGLQKILSLNPTIKNSHRIKIHQEIVVFAPDLPEKNIERKINSLNALATDDEKKEFSTLGVEIGVFQSRIDSKDSSTNAKSTLGSSFNPTLGIRWEQNWADDFVSFLTLKGKSENFKTTSTAHSRVNGKVTTFGSDLGIRVFRTNNNDVNLFASIGFTQNPFVYAKTATELEVDAVTVPVVKISGSFLAKKSKTFSIAIKPEVIGIGGATHASYKVKNGFGFYNSILITQKTKSNQDYYAGLNLGFTKQNTSISTQSYSQIGITFGIPFTFEGID